MALKDRLKKAREARQMTQEQLALAAKCGQSTIGNLESGEQASTKHMPKIAEALGVPATWLTDDDYTGPDPLAAIEPSNVDPGPERIGRVPLISSIQAGEMTEATDLHAPGVAEDWVPTTAPVHRHTYALRVKGDSMEPMIPEGYVVIVEPDADPREGDVVVARNGDLEANIKILVRVSGDWYLKPANKDYKPKPLGDAKIIGVVVAAEKKFR